MHDTLLIQPLLSFLLFNQPPKPSCRIKKNSGVSNCVTGVCCTDEVGDLKCQDTVEVASETCAAGLAEKRLCSEGGCGKKYQCCKNSIEDDKFCCVPQSTSCSEGVCNDLAALGFGARTLAENRYLRTGTNPSPEDDPNKRQ